MAGSCLGVPVGQRCEIRKVGLTLRAGDATENRITVCGDRQRPCIPAEYGRFLPERQVLDAESRSAVALDCVS